MPTEVSLRNAFTEAYSAKSFLSKTKARNNSFTFHSFYPLQIKSDVVNNPLITIMNSYAIRSMTEKLARHMYLLLVPTAISAGFLKITADKRAAASTES